MEDVAINKNPTMKQALNQAMSGWKMELTISKGVFINKSVL
jgi:hypothetical protein